MWVVFCFSSLGKLLSITFHAKFGCIMLYIPDELSSYHYSPTPSTIFVHCNPVPLPPQTREFPHDCCLTTHWHSHTEPFQKNVIPKNIENFIYARPPVYMHPKMQHQSYTIKNICAIPTGLSRAIGLRLPIVPVVRLGNFAGQDTDGRIIFFY